MSRVFAVGVLLLGGWGCSDFKTLAADACAGTPGCRVGDAGEPDAGAGDAGSADAGADVWSGAFWGATSVSTQAANDFLYTTRLASLPDGRVAVGGMIRGTLQATGASWATLTPLALRLSVDGGVTVWAWDAGAPGAVVGVAPGPGGAAVLAVTNVDVDGAGRFAQAAATGALVTTSFAGPPRAVLPFSAPDASFAPGQFGFQFTSLGAPGGAGGDVIATGVYSAVPGVAVRFGGLGAIDEQAPAAAFVSSVQRLDGGLTSRFLALASCLDGGVQQFGDMVYTPPGTLSYSHDVATTCTGAKTTLFEPGAAPQSSVAPSVYPPGRYVDLLKGEHAFTSADLLTVANDPGRSRAWVLLGPAGTAGLSRLDLNATPPAGRLDVPLGSLNGGRVTDLAVDAQSGAVYEAGTFEGKIRFGSLTAETGGPPGAGFIVKVDAAGALQGLVVIEPDSGNTFFMTGLTVNEHGVWVAITYSGALTYQGHTFTSVGVGTVVLRLSL